MTGSPEEDMDGGRPDPLEPLLRPAVEFLPVPPGAFERIRRTAARRRRIRAAAGGTLAVAVLAGSFYLVGSVTTHDSQPVVTPPVSTSRVTAMPTPVPTGTTTGTTTGTPSPRPPAPPPDTHQPTTRTPSPPAGTPMCATSQLSASLGGSNAGAGNLYRYLVLTNHSGTSCHLTGYPGLSMLDAGGAQIGVPATRQPLAYQPVELRPGGSVSDTIHTINHQGNCLPASAQLRIYPPGNKASLIVPGQITDCDNQFTVTPFTAGSTGNPPG